MFGCCFVLVLVCLFGVALRLWCLIVLYLLLSGGFVLCLCGLFSLLCCLVLLFVDSVSSFCG